MDKDKVNTVLQLTQMLVLHFVVKVEPNQILIKNFNLPSFETTKMGSSKNSTFGFFTIGLSECISVRLSDRSEVTQYKINFVKNYPQWGLNSQPPDHQSNALLTVLGRNLLEISEVNFLLFHAPLHMLDFVHF